MRAVQILPAVASRHMWQRKSSPCYSADQRVFVQQATIAAKCDNGFVQPETSLSKDHMKSMTDE